jgi:ABC-type sugar transport system permease subunit
VTGLVAGASVAAELGLGIVIALLINHSFRGRGLVRASVLVPWALTTVVSAKMWAWIYDGRYGIADRLLQRVAERVGGIRAC